MRISEIKSLIKSLYPDGPSVFLFGPPGIGKSNLVFQVSQELGVACHTFDMQLQDEITVRGIPDVSSNGDFFNWKYSSELPFEGNDKFPEKGILFLDEFNCARPAIQQIGYQLTLDKRLAGKRLKQNWYIVLAGNRQQDSGAVFEIPAPLRNRVVQVDVEVNLNEWIKWAMENNIAQEIVSYIMWSCQNLDSGVDHLGSLIDFDPDSRAFPSPRAWGYLVNNLIKRNIPLTIELLAGCIGEKTAVEFLSYLEVYKELPDTEDVLSGKVPFPDKINLGYAVSVAIINYCTSAETIEKFLQAVKQNLIPEEFAILIIKQLQTLRLKELFQSPSWKEVFVQLGNFLR